MLNKPAGGVLALRAAALLTDLLSSLGGMSFVK